MTEIEDVVLNIKGSYYHSRTLKYDNENNMLFINYDDIKIMFFKLNENNDFDFFYIDLEVFKVERISDFQLMPGNRTAVLTKDGQIVLFQYDPERMDSKILYSFRMLSYKKSETEFEKFDSITVDTHGRYIVAVSSIGREGMTKDMIWLQVDKETGAIHRLARKSIAEEYSFINERKSLQFYGYMNDFPVVYTCERFGKGQLHSYFFDGKEIQKFLPAVQKFSVDENFRLYMQDGYMFMLDVSGRLAKYQLKKLTKVEVEENMKETAHQKPTAQIIKPEIGEGTVSVDEIKEEDVAMVGSQSDL